MDLGRQGRAGIADFDALMRHAGVESWLERTFLELLEGTGLPKPSIQRTYHADGVHVARVDFDFDPLSIVVERFATPRENESRRLSNSDNWPTWFRTAVRVAQGGVP